MSRDGTGDSACGLRTGAGTGHRPFFRGPVPSDASPRRRHGGAWRTARRPEGAAVSAPLWFPFLIRGVFPGPYSFLALIRSWTWFLDLDLTGGPGGLREGVGRCRGAWPRSEFRIPDRFLIGLRLPAPYGQAGAGIAFGRHRRAPDRRGLDQGVARARRGVDFRGFEQGAESKAGRGGEPRRPTATRAWMAVAGLVYADRRAHVIETGAWSHPPPTT